MQMRSIKRDDHVLVDVRGIVFQATVAGKNKGLVHVIPDEVKRVTYRFVPARMVREKLSPDRLKVAR